MYDFYGSERFSRQVIINAVPEQGKETSTVVEVYLKDNPAIKQTKRKMLLLKK